jgi:hypothetical protein
MLSQSGPCVGFAVLAQSCYRDPEVCSQVKHLHIRSRAILLAIGTQEKSYRMVLAVSENAEVAVRLHTTLLCAASLATGRATPAVRV